MQYHFEKCRRTFPGQYFTLSGRRHVLPTGKKKVGACYEEKSTVFSVTLVVLTALCCVDCSKHEHAFGEWRVEYEGDLRVYDRDIVPLDTKNACIMYTVPETVNSGTSHLIAFHQVFYEIWQPFHTALRKLIACDARNIYHME